MTPSLFDTLFEEWKTRELSYQKNKKRRYLHFDRHIQFHRNIQMFKKYFSNSLENIPKHSFYPFIKSDIATPRIKHKRDAITNKKIIFKTKKIRPIAYASHFDAFIYSWYATILNDAYIQSIRDRKIEDCILAYIEKNKRSNIDFAYEAFSFIKEGHVALAYDLKSYFDGLDHDILKEKWCALLKIDRLPKDHFKVFRTLTDYSFVRKENLDIVFPNFQNSGLSKERICSPSEFRDLVAKEFIEKNEFFNNICESNKFGRKCGIPQGSPISACLSNIYLIDFDEQIFNEASNRHAMYRRYCDDLLIICKEDDKDYFQNLIEISIKHCQVQVNKEKIEVVFFKEFKPGIIRGYNNERLDNFKNLQYLGFEFNGQNIYIRSSSMARYSQRMRSKIFQAVNDAYCEDFGQGDFIFKKKLSERFSNNGKRNFISYGYRAGKKIMYSKTIIKQVKNSSIKINSVMSKAVQLKENNIINQVFPTNVLGDAVSQLHDKKDDSTNHPS